MQEKFPSGITVEDVFERYYNTVYRLAFARMKNVNDAEDVLMTVFLRLVSSKICFNDEEHIKAWLIKVTVNASKSLLTSAVFRLSAPLDDSPETEMQEKSEVYYAVLELPSRYRTVVHLFYYEGYSVKEIADILGAKEATVKTWLRRAREKLATTLKGEIFDV